MIKMSCTILKDSMKKNVADNDLVETVSEMVKRAIDQHFQFSDNKFSDLNISIHFSEDGKANLVLS